MRLSVHEFKGALHLHNSKIPVSLSPYMHSQMGVGGEKQIHYSSFSPLTLIRECVHCKDLHPQYISTTAL